MSGIVTSAVYRELIQDDIDWLVEMPRTLERNHIIEILRWHIEHAASVIMYEHERRMKHEQPATNPTEQNPPDHP